MRIQSETGLARFQRALAACPGLPRRNPGSHPPLEPTSARRLGFGFSLLGSVEVIQVSAVLLRVGLTPEGLYRLATGWLRAAYPWIGPLQGRTPEGFNRLFNPSGVGARVGVDPRVAPDGATRG